MKSYKDVKAQIAKLEMQAAALRQRELKSVIAQVRKTIEQYELTPADLGLGGAAPKAGRKRVASKGSRGRASIGVAKYRDPATGKTWTGHGRPPAWIVGAKDPQAYLIAGAPAAEPAKAAAKKKAKAAPARKAAAKKKPVVRRKRGKAAAPADSGAANA